MPDLQKPILDPDTRQTVSNEAKETNLVTKRNLSRQTGSGRVLTCKKTIPPYGVQGAPKGPPPRALLERHLQEAAGISTIHQLPAPIKVFLPIQNAVGQATVEAKGRGGDIGLCDGDLDQQTGWLHRHAHVATPSRVGHLERCYAAARVLRPKIPEGRGNPWLTTAGALLPAMRSGGAWQGCIYPAASIVGKQAAQARRGPRARSMRQGSRRVGGSSPSQGQASVRVGGAQAAWPLCGFFSLG